jgi:serine/threonine-protein kinase
VFRYGALAEGVLLAGYRIKEQVGQGGMATVYRAHDLRLDRWVALKVLAPDAAADSGFRRRFIRESRAAAAVDHPHIIPIHEAGEADGVLYIAMRYVEGGDLSALLKGHRILPLDRACDIVDQVAAALDAAHSRGLVHRDVKPANILLGAGTGRDRADHVYLTDFGITNRLPRTHDQGKPAAGGEFLGTPRYVAPEEIEGGHVDGRADLYALACTAYQMLCGAPPFDRGDSAAVLWAQVYEPPPMPTARRPDLPPGIDQVFAKALAKSRRERYTTCLDFATALRAAAGLADRFRPIGVAAGPHGYPATDQHGYPAADPRGRPAADPLAGSAARTDRTQPFGTWQTERARRPAGNRLVPARARGGAARNLPLVIVALIVVAAAAGVATMAFLHARHGGHPAKGHAVSAVYVGGDAGPGCPAVAGASAAAAGDGGDGWAQVGGGLSSCHGRALASRKTGRVTAVQDTFGWTFKIGHPATCRAAIFIADVNPSSGTAHYEVFATDRPPRTPVATFDISQGQSKGMWVPAGPWHVPTGTLQIQLTDAAAFPGDINHVTASATRATCQ